MSTGPGADVAEIKGLLDRCHTLGADHRNTNYAGGNASAKIEETDPVTGDARTVLYVKGSGGDLATLTADGLAALDLARLRGLRSLYRGVEHEDEMVELFDHCRCGLGSAAPSIDTAMHGLLEPAHVDHLHPDGIIALATAEDGEALVKECFGGSVGWVAWRRPGFQLGIDIAELQAANPSMRGVVLGGHGLTSWGSDSESCREATLDIIRQAERFIEERGRANPFGPVRAGHEPLPEEERRRRAAELAPVIRAIASTDRRMVGHFTDAPVVLDFLSREAAPRLVGLGTSCPDHFLRTKVRPLLLDLETGAPLDAQRRRLAELHAEYREEYRSYYERHATEDSPAMRGADPAIVLLPGVGMFSFGLDAQTARVAGEFYINAINVMRGAEALSTYSPIPESEKFRIEYWQLEEQKLARRPKPKALAGRVALVTGAASGIGLAIARRFSEEGAAVVVTDIDIEGARAAAEEMGGPDRAVACHLDVTDADAVEAAFRHACLAYGGVDLVVNNAGLSISKPLHETDAADWDLQHNVMARGSFLVSKAAAAVMVELGKPADILYIVSKNGIVAGPDNVAYGAAKADQAHQVRLLAAELGPRGIRVNGINPDGVVRGSGIFANGWGAKRADVYGVPESELGQFYAERTLLKTEVLPEHIADAAFALVGGQLSLTTGTLIPVDGGTPMAFLR